MNENAKKLLLELIKSSIRCVDESWTEDPRPVRDGTKMIMIPEVIYERFRKAVDDIKQETAGEFRIRYDKETDNFYYDRK